LPHIRDYRRHRGKVPNETFQPENTLDRFLCSYRHLLVGGMNPEPIQVKKEWVLKIFK